ncbi:MAG TPA: ribonuclease HII [Bacillota bacterium]|nr:ribonuclease HII [Bacillota bacterium]
MEKLTIAEIKHLFTTGQITESMIDKLKRDERKGVQKLVKAYETNKAKEKALKEKFAQMCRYENKHYSNGLRFIAGVDEAGRGPLAGPVVAAAVILPKDFQLLGLNDSKQLTEATRNEFFRMIKHQAVTYGLSVVDNETIDRLNIHEAVKLAMHRAITQLEPMPEHILIDAVNIDDLPCSSEVIKKGDANSISIAAASILAKVTRDQIMKDLHKTYPLYGFDSNNGYGTKHHVNMLQKYGPTPYHRKSFAPVRHALLTKEVSFDGGFSNN